MKKVFFALILTIVSINASAEVISWKSRAYAEQINGIWSEWVEDNSFISKTSESFLLGKDGKTTYFRILGSKRLYYPDENGFTEIYAEEFKCIDQNGSVCGIRYRVYIDDYGVSQAQIYIIYSNIKKLFDVTSYE